MINTFPKGNGIFIRHINKSDSVMMRLDRYVRRFKEARFDYVAIGGPWFDTYGLRMINSVDVIAKVSKVFEEASITPYVWGYPWYTEIDSFVDVIKYIYDKSVVRGCLLNPELGLVGKSEAATRLMQGIIALNPYMSIGMSTFALPKFHKNFPYKEFVEDIDYQVDYVAPQVYNFTPEQISECLTSYKKLGFDNIVLSYSLFRKYSDENGAMVTTPYTPELFEPYYKDIRAVSENNIAWASNFLIDDLVEFLKTH